MTPQIVVCACIHHKFDGVTKILVTKRSSKSDFLPGVYEIPGGHVDEGESNLQALKRELIEELNLQIKVGDICGSFEYSHNNELTTEIAYLAEATSDIDEITIKEDEIDSYCWISESEIESIVAPTKAHDDQELPILRQAFRLLK